MKTIPIAALLLVLAPVTRAQVPTLRPLAGSSQSAPSSFTIFASITGQKSGIIKGEVTQKGREGLHEVLDFEMGVTSPRDPASGLAAGRRQHKPLRIIKRITNASPLLFSAVVNNENLSTVRFDLYQPNRLGAAGGIGAEILSQQVTLQNASISSWRQYLHPDFGLVEEVQFTYQKITIENKQGGTMGQDDWQGSTR